MSIEEARLALEQYDPQRCLDLLSTVPDDIHKLQLMGEALLELGMTQEAFDCLKVCCDELDPEGLFGYDKFLWVGQLLGGFEGKSYFEKGIEGMIKTDAKSNADSRLKLINALCSLIEVWMTDLCMEPEAESECDKLITEAFKVDDNNAEVWNIAGSIRLSQQREDEAKDALLKSKELYEKNFENLDADSISSLVRLAQSMMEIDLYDEVHELTKQALKLDDQVPEIYYLNGIANYEKYKLTKDARYASRAKDALVPILELGDVDDEVLAVAKENLASIEDVVYDGENTDSEDGEFDEEL